MAPAPEDIKDLQSVLAPTHTPDVALIRRRGQRRRRTRQVVAVAGVAAVAAAVGSLAFATNRGTSQLAPADGVLSFPTLDQNVTFLPVGYYADVQISDTGCPFVTVTGGDAGRARAGEYVLVARPGSGMTVRHGGEDGWAVYDETGALIAEEGTPVVYTPQPGLNEVADEGDTCGPLLESGAHVGIMGKFNPPGAP